MLSAKRLLAAAALAGGFAGTALAPAAFAPPAFAHGAMWHTRSLVGAPVFNDQHQQIGTVADVLVSPMGGKSEAVLSVGMFVGGHKKVEVPLSHLAMAPAAMGHGAMMMHGATKAEIEALPAYTGGGDG
jgi:sporulation protein YlmC with PRC-barrel domain